MRETAVASPPLDSGGGDGRAGAGATDEGAGGGWLGRQTDRARGGSGAQHGEALPALPRQGAEAGAAAGATVGASRAPRAVELWEGTAEGNAVVVQALLAEQGVDASVRTVQRALRRGRRGRAAQVATVRFETAPGHQMQIDFGEKWVSLGGHRGEGVSCSWRCSRLLAADLRPRLAEPAAGRLARGHRRGVPALRRRAAAHTGRQRPRRWSSNMTARPAASASIRPSSRSAGTGASAPRRAGRTVRAPRARPSRASGT